MAMILLAPPAAEPMTLAEAKAYLRVEHDDDDDLIATLIKGARGHVEVRTRRALITQTWRVVLDVWPRGGRLILLLAPVRALVAARVYDAGGTPHAIDAEAFIVDAASAPGAIGFPPWAVAAPERTVAGIELDVEFGYGVAAADIPEPLRQAMRLLLAHWYENRGIVGNGAHPALPASIEALLAPYRVLTL